MGQKLCAFYQKCGAFWGEKIVRFFVLFLAKVGAPFSSKLLKTLVRTSEKGAVCFIWLIMGYP